LIIKYIIIFFFSSRRRHTRSKRDWSSDVCSSDLRVNRMEHSSRILGFYKMTIAERKTYLIERCGLNQESANHLMSGDSLPEATRSEERRVGKECRYQRRGDH